MTEDEAKRERVDVAARTVLVDQVTVEVARAFDAAGIASILLKGPTFAAWLYPTGGRSYGDTDLLVSVDDVVAAGVVLEELGFTNATEGLAPSEHTFAQEYVRSRPNAGRQVLDLHWGIDPAQEPAETWRVLSAETERMSLGPIQVTALNEAGRALHVALHAAHHGVLGPQPDDHGGQTGEDLRRALVQLPEDVWRRAADIARAMGSEDALAFGLRMAPDGVAMADRLELTDEPPAVWRFPGTGVVPRGAKRIARLRDAPTLRAKAAVIARGAFPTPSHVRRTARTRLAQRVLVFGYFEYWWTAATGLMRGARFGRR